MCVNPDPSKLFGTQPAINLAVEELGDRIVLERDRDDGTVLAHEDEVFNEQQVIGGGDPEAADFGLAEITQEQELGPRRRMKAEHRALWSRLNQTLFRRWFPRRGCRAEFPAM